MRYHTEEYKARRAIRNAVKSGHVAKPASCQTCGIAKPLQAHHEDYSKPLEVKWLCAKCHGIEHRKHKGPSELQTLREENAGLRAALKICAAEWSTPPTTVGEVAGHVGREFVRRMSIAAAALGDEQKVPDVVGPFLCRECEDHPATKTGLCQMCNAIR